MSQLSDFAEIVQEGQELSRETLYPATITIGGVPYACSGGVVNEQDSTFGKGGEVVRRIVRFCVRRALFADPPEIGFLLTFEGTEYRILAIPNAKDPVDTAYVITAGNVVEPQ